MELLDTPRDVGGQAVELLKADTADAGTPDLYAVDGVQEGSVIHVDGAEGEGGGPEALFALREHQHQDQDNNGRLDLDGGANPVRHLLGAGARRRARQAAEQVSYQAGVVVFMAIVARHHVVVGRCCRGADQGRGERAGDGLEEEEEEETRTERRTAGAGGWPLHLLPAGNYSVLTPLFCCT